MGGSASGRRERDKVPDRADLDFAGVGSAPMDFTGVATAVSAGALSQSAFLSLPLYHIKAGTPFIQSTQL